MSTYYFIVCDETHLRCDVASVTSGVGALGDSEECLRTFLVAHRGKTLRMVNEHDNDGYSEDFTDWIPEDNARWNKDGIMPTLEDGRRRREEFYSQPQDTRPRTG